MWKLSLLKTELESLVHSKACETPRDNTERDKKKKAKVKILGNSTNQGQSNKVKEIEEDVLKTGREPRASDTGEF